MVYFKLKDEYALLHLLCIISVLFKHEREIIQQFAFYCVKEWLLLHSQGDTMNSQSCFVLLQIVMCYAFPRNKDN